MMRAAQPGGRPFPSIARSAALALLLLLLSCHDPSDGGLKVDGGVADPCTAGLRTYKGACIPIFDECNDTEVPLLGGGCKRVGVAECDGGISGPPDWACRRIGLPAKCLPGWQMSGQGWCEPLSPLTKCPAGTMATVGKSACQPVGDCGTGKYGTIKTTSKTVFVDAAYTSASDGSQSRPYPSIAEAVMRSASGGHIAVAAGDYKGLVAINKPLTIDGRCASQVSVENLSPSIYATLGISSKGVTISGLTIKGASFGVDLTDAGVTLSQVIISGCKKEGIVARGSTLVVRDSLIKENASTGVWAYRGSTATIERTAIVDTLPQQSGAFGGALYIGVDDDTRDSSLTLRDSIIARNTSTAITIISAKATIERTIIRDTLPEALSGTGGNAVIARVGKYRTKGSELKISDCLVAANRSGGIFLGGTNATIARTVVRDTKETKKLLKGGYGIQVNTYGKMKSPSTLLLSDSVVSNNKDAGVQMINSTATIRQSIIEGTSSNPEFGLRGSGIAVDNDDAAAKPSVLTAEDVLLKGNSSAGLVVLSSTASLKRVVVRDTRPRGSDKMQGIGILAISSSSITAKIPSKLTMKDCLVERNHTSGLNISNSTATLTDTIVRDTLPEQSDQGGGTGLRVFTSTISISQSIIATSRATGFYMEDSTVSADSIMLKNTLPMANTLSAGFGLQSHARAGEEDKHLLTIRGSIIEDNVGVGLNLRTRSAISSSVIRNTAVQHSDGQYGDGLVASAGKSKVSVQNCIIEKSGRAGVIYTKTNGIVGSSTVTDGELSIALDGGANVEIRSDNVMERNTRDGVSFTTNLGVAPVPDIPNIK